MQSTAKISSAMRQHVQTFIPASRTGTGLALATAIAFGLVVYVVFSLTRTSTLVCAIWPANGVFLAGVLVARSSATRRAIVILSLAANVIANLFVGEPLAPSVGYTIANTSEVILAFYVLRHFKLHERAFTDVNSFQHFIAICGVFAPILGAALGAAAISLTFGVPYFPAYKTWFFADSLGLLVITPALVLLNGKIEDGAVRPAARSVVLHFVALFLVSTFVFVQTTAPLLFLITPVSVLIAFRLGAKYAALANLGLTLFALVFTYQGLGPVALMTSTDPSMHVVIVQLFCLINMFTGLAVAANIAERNSLKVQLEKLSSVNDEQRRQLHAALDSMAQGVCLFDADGRVVMRNNLFLKLYGLTDIQVPISATFDDMIGHCGVGKVGPESDQHILGIGAIGDVDQKLLDGRVIRLSQRALEEGGIICTYTDITDEKRAERELVHSTLHDVLTGLPNRRFLMQSLEHVVATAAGGSAAVMLLDVDHFKSINDTLGHAAGDDLLQALSFRLQACVGAAGMVARLGGDEFAVLMAEGEAEKPAVIAIRILETVSQPIHVNGKPLSVTMSIGIAALPAGGHTPSDALKSADDALYCAKRNGRNAFAFCSGTSEDGASAPSEAEQELLLTKLKTIADMLSNKEKVVTAPSAAA